MTGLERNGAGAVRRPTAPAIRTITLADIRASLAEGVEDFRRLPLFGMAIGGMFALIGMVLVFALAVADMPWMIYPFAIGFPLVGPFAAVGLYEVSRRLEAGKPLHWNELFSVVWAQRRREVPWMGFAMLFVFWVWMYQVRLLLVLFLGRMSFSSLDKFVSLVVSTPQGWMFLAVGHVVGGLLALLLFSITVISIPMLLDRNVDFVTAMITSLRVVAQNPVPMLAWGLVVTLAVLAACLPLFLGLVVVLPVLGHTTWHLYRRAVVPAGG